MPTGVYKHKATSGSFKKGHKFNNGKRNALGYIHSKETRKKMSEAHKGDKSHFWKGGISKENEICRKISEYREWRSSVFKRDNFTCQICESVGGKLNAHHIKEFSKHKELRFAIDNGITLCEECHKNIHKNK